MSDSLDTLINVNLARSVRAFDRARATYRLVRNGLMGLGFSAAVVLPLASSNPTETDPKDKPAPNVVRNELNYHAPPAGDGVGVITMPAPTVQLDLVNVQFAPSNVRDWHRTTFSRSGDEFWALPDAHFVMRFQRDADWSSDCLQDACEGTFSFASERYLGTGVTVDPAWEVTGRRVATSGASGLSSMCRTISSPEQQRTALTPIEHCEFRSKDRDDETMKSTDHKPDICIWMRRSEHLEQPKLERGTVALDIKWMRIDSDNEECRRIYEDQEAHDHG